MDMEEDSEGEKEMSDRKRWSLSAFQIHFQNQQLRQTVGYIEIEKELAPTIWHLHNVLCKIVKIFDS